MTSKILLAVLACAFVAMPLCAKEPCDGFAWDVKAERALFASAGQSLAAGKDLSEAPSIAAQTMYTLALAPQGDVHFALTPGKKMLTDGAYAGMVRLRVATAGVYRVSLDQAFWIDMVSGQQLLSTVDFQGSPGCNAPHKIVEFNLPADTDLVLQLSASTQGSVRVSVTRTTSPPAS